MSEEEAEEVLRAYQEQHNRCYEKTATTMVEVRAWCRRVSGDSVCWQDLTLLTHRNVRTGDVVYEWNYGMDGNDYGSYHILRRHDSDDRGDGGSRGEEGAYRVGGKQVADENEGLKF